MTLAEYIAQEVPIRKPTVYLEEGEYQLGTSITMHRDSVKKETRTQIWVQGFPFEYCLIHDTLYTTDSDGNPKKISVFRIKQHEKSSKPRR